MAMNRTLKRAILSALILAGLVAVFLVWLRKDTKKHSPAAVAEFHNGNLNLKVNYCRPYAKGRVIFGDEAAGALQPYGKYWRLGANEATTFEVSEPLLFNNDKELPAGKYALYAYPAAEDWTICVNKDWDRWGAQEADPKLDVLRTMVKADQTAPFQEQFVISFEPADSDGNTVMVMNWEKVLLKVPLKKK